jgi:integrase
MRTFREAFVTKYPKYGKLIDDFTYANDIDDPDWNDITKISLSNFVDYLEESKASSSVKTYCAMLKSVLNLYSDEVALPKDYAKILSCKGSPSQNVYLTSEELKEIIGYYPSNDTERYVRDVFCICSLVGCRHSDGIKLTRENVVDGRIVYISQKTKVKSEVPLSGAVIRMLDDIDSFNLRDFKICDNTFNSTIRNICQKCGITHKVKLFRHGIDCEGEKWAFISSHSARRTCASNLYILGCDLFTISKILGHTSIETTKNYICAPLNLNERVMNYFNQFK